MLSAGHVVTPATPGTSEAGDPHVLANYLPRPSDYRRRSGVSPPAVRYRFAGGAMLPQPQGAPCATPSLAEHCNSPRRRCCCAWCHPVVSTAADTHSVKPSSGPPRPARHQLQSDFPRELEGVNSPCVSPILTMKLQLCAGCAWRRGSKPGFGATRPPPPHPTPHTEPNTLSGARPENP